MIKRKATDIGHAARGHHDAEGIGGPDRDQNGEDKSASGC